MLVRLSIAVAAACAAAIPSISIAQQQSPLLVRARAAYIVPADKSDPIPALSLPADAIDVSNKTIPEVDFTWFFSPNLAAELILTYPQKHKVSVDGLGHIGTFRHLPPTLTLQYHFLPDQTFSPYVGAGLNYTRVSNVSLAVPGADLERNSFGLALQIGADVKIDRNWSVNFDAKYVQIRVDLEAGGAALGEVKVDPMIYSIGVGYRF